MGWDRIEFRDHTSPQLWIYWLDYMDTSHGNLLGRVLAYKILYKKVVLRKLSTEQGIIADEK
ncbi:uncharacterized protein RSE6_03280 [Rhynchosporium secalis]|uniref:Uncharacterized protein n=1 Tax=Rhynchosporium secalis TaxID=38038 RepID=A0A1E1M2D2_RHYSE|nr:uncharacterized protein RSE6_03280 [Rhynchosporium secalis]